MAKNFPFFKFSSGTWIAGNIVLEPLDVQGLFINICAMYWERDGELSIREINRRFKQPALTDRLIEGDLIKIKNDFVSIEFLDEQFEEVAKISKSYSERGLKGAAARREALGKNKENVVTVPEEINAKQNKIDFFFHDFPNSVALESVLKVTYPDAHKLPKEDFLRKKNELLKFLPEFRKFAQLDYPNMVKFAEHFKNWYLKQAKNIEIINPHKTTVSFGTKRK